MTKTENIRKIRTYLAEGDVEQALKELEAYTRRHAPKQQKDVIALRATFLNAKRQFETKGIMTRPEYDLVFAKTVNGIQNILAADAETLANLETPKSKRWLWIVAAGVLCFVVLPFLGYFYLKNGIQPSEEHLEVLPLDSIVQENTAVQEVPKETAFKPEKIHTSAGEKKKNPKENKAAQQKEVLTSTPPKQEKPMEVEEITPKKTPEYLEVKLIVNSDYSNAEILIDGKAATIIQNTPIIKTIRVEKKTEMHHIELNNGDRPCVQNILIQTNGQKVTMNC